MNAKGLAVVTGGASGIGEATVRCFAADGYDVAILDRNAAAGEALAANAISTGIRKAKFYSCDVADAANVDAVAAIGGRADGAGPHARDIGGPHPEHRVCDGHGSCRP